MKIVRFSIGLSIQSKYGSFIFGGNKHNQSS